MFKWLQETDEEYNKEDLMSLSEKELMVEMLMELKKLTNKCDEIKHAIRRHSH